MSTGSADPEPLPATAAHEGSATAEPAALDAEEPAQQRRRLESQSCAGPESVAAEAPAAEVGEAIDDAAISETGAASAAEVVMADEGCGEAVASDAPATKLTEVDGAAAEVAVSLLSFVFEPKPEGFSPLYLHAPARNTAAVNAGDYRLYVGGGAINRAFGELFKAEQWLKFGHKSWEYEELHKLLLKASRESGHALMSAAEVPEAKELLPKLRLAAAFGRAGPALDTDAEGLEGSTESIFIDVFEEGSRPFHAQNVAMVYVVGPKGEDCTGPKAPGSGVLLSREPFLASLERLAASSIASLGEYNSRCNAEGLPQIEELRWCLVSGGVYRHGDVSKEEVAECTMRSMLSVKGVPLTVTFAYDEDCFQKAARASDL